jgi:sugar phosphate isomerase/epimerase
MLGLTSISFRKLGAERIISLVKQAGLDGIEWGGDIHVPPGDSALAARIKERTQKEGLAVFSYGSYYHLLKDSENFSPVLETAAALGAPMIRIWAGGLPSAQADTGYYEKAAAELHDVCARAAEHGIRIGLEYHRGTLTDTCDSAQKLLSLAACENLSTYWQPNPDLPLAEHSREIELLLPRVSSIHVFHWEKNNVRRPLAEGESVWKEYMRLLGKERNYIMEFVLDDNEDNFLADAESLKRMIQTYR